MRKPTKTTIATYALLALAGGLTFILPGTVIDHVDASLAAQDIVRLNGVVRDFQSTHSDFNAEYSDAPGHIAGLVGSELGADGDPAYDGSGNRVLSPATDSQGRSIAPVLASNDEGVEFTIVNGRVIASESFAAMITVVGAAMNSGSYEMPVTVKMNIGSEVTNPFGNFTMALAGNVNKAGNPRDYISPSIYAANTPVYVTGRSWSKKQSSYSGLSESHWQTFYEFNTNGATQQVKVLRDGDLAPNTPGFLTQLAAKQFLLPYIDPVTQRVTLYDNQVIYLFELGTTNMSALSADFQDVVVVLTMAKSPASFDSGVSHGNPCGPDDDTVATLDPTPTNGAITDADTFKHWFNDTMGSNLSAPSSLDLVRQSDDTYLFDDATDEHYSKMGGFYPADGRMYGDVDSSGHNQLFTYQFEAKFKYDDSVPQFFSTATDMEVWVFINGKLVIDLAGFHAATEQRIDLSRLCLEDDKEYTLSFFLANRYAPQAKLRIHTNIEFMGDMPTYIMSAGCD